jgi:myo-inositol-1(or 4)-monophosphatase
MEEETSRGIEELTEFAKDVIRQCGDEALKFYGKGNPRLKFDMGLVTEAELHLSEFFERHLHTRFPEHELFMNNWDSQEYTHDEKRYVWIFDPIDGVANFQAGIPIWGISLSLLENFWPILGLFYMPASGDLFHARVDRTAFKDKEEIRISEQASINDESLFLTYSRFHNRYKINFPGKIRNMGCTSAHICYVATGRAEAAVIANESYRDLAAARIIIEAAGGKLLKMDGSEVFLNEYLDGRVIDTHMLAVSPESFSEIRHCIEETS